MCRPKNFDSDGQCWCQRRVLLSLSSASNFSTEFFICSCLENVLTWFCFLFLFFLLYHVTCANASSEWLAKGNRVMPCCHPSLSVTSQQVRAHSAVSAPYTVSVAGNRWQSHLVPELLVEIRLVTSCCCGRTLYFERCWHMSHRIFIYIASAKRMLHKQSSVNFITTGSVLEADVGGHDNNNEVSGKQSPK